MDALNNILERVSARTLGQPHPNKTEMKKVYKAALRAPDHAWLRPSSFIEVKGEGLNKLSDIKASSINDASIALETEVLAPEAVGPSNKLSSI